MLKEISSGLSRFFTRDKVIIFVILFILMFALFGYSNSKGMYLDGYRQYDEDSNTDPTKEPSVKNTPAQNYVQPPAGMSPPPNAQQTGYSGHSTSSPEELLPKDANSQWSSLNPVANSNGIVMPDLLQAGYHIGLDTIGQTLRNANQQLRSDPIIPRADVGPWNMSTIEPDIGRTPLEIGNCR